MSKRVMSILVGLSAIGLLLAISAGTASAAGSAGSLDSTFGSGGKILTNLGVQALPSDAILQSDGKIVVSAELGFYFGVVRFQLNGRLDPAFGNGGSSQAVFNTLNGQLVNYAPANALALQPDGKVVDVGEVHAANGQFDEFGLARFTANGSLDTTFGSGGTVTTEFFAPPLAGVHEAADAVLVQPDGKILVGGSAKQGQNRFAPTMTAVARYNRDGSLDMTFGSGGRVLANGVGNVTALGLDAQQDIFLLAGGLIAELSPTGSFDASVTPAPITASSTGRGNVFLSDGRYLSDSPITVVRHDTDMQVRRFAAAGGSDPTFTTTTFDFTGQEGSDSGNAVAIQPNGQILVAGGHFFNTSVFGLARVNSSGGLDASFGNGGTLTTTFFGNDLVAALIVQSDGKILAVGSATNNITGESDLALARYLSQ
jgi:uncharacterized delta-60 repeat protein